MVNQTRFSYFQERRIAGEQPCPDVVFVIHSCVICIRTRKSKRDNVQLLDQDKQELSHDVCEIKTLLPNLFHKWFQFIIANSTIHLEKNTFPPVLSNHVVIKDGGYADCYRRADEDAAL
jgi:hypothetical protein